MRKPTAVPMGRVLLVIVPALLVVLYACQDVTDAGDPLFAITANKQLVISGDEGGGSGTVTVPPTAGRAQLTCVITLGQAASTNCSRFYPTGTLLSLTASPAPGHAFQRWTGACSGSGVCTIAMTQLQRVTAAFTPPASDARLTVTGSGSGDGAVTAASPPGGINCTVTAGESATTGCSALYPVGTAVTLTATPQSGHSFGGWGGDCTPAGAETQCQLQMTRTRSVSVTFNAPGIPAPEPTLGKWGKPFATPVVAVHLGLLPNGRVWLWGYHGQPWLWNASMYPSEPAAGFSEVSTATELFCSGHAFLPDGSLLVVGGHDEVKGNGYGVPDVNVFNGTSWQSAFPMAEGRWYPTATTMGNGEVLVTGGTDANKVNVRIPEIWDGSSWRQLASAYFGMPYYPRMFVAPSGKLFYAGEGPITKYLNPSGSGNWTNVGARIVGDRNYGTAVMVDGKVLYAGGGGKSISCPAPVTNTAELIDLTAGAAQWRAVGSMAHRRRQLNLTILADGKVLATGGSSACGFNNESAPVYAAEVWDPVTEQWSTLASMRVMRMYHSTAILLPDGRVLSAGGGDGEGGATPRYTAEVFTPPYLFNPNGTLAPRPTYTLSSTVWGYNQSVVVETPDPVRIARVNLVRLSAVTHAFNETQQLKTLSFTVGSDGHSLSVSTPASGNLAPPGPYMLFLLDQQGVPSVAEIVILR